MSVTQKAHPARTGDIPETTRLRLFQLQVEIRHTEKARLRPVPAELGESTSHLAPARKRSQPGFAAAMNKDDYTFLHLPRTPSHARARRSMKAVLGELMAGNAG